MSKQVTPFLLIISATLTGCFDDNAKQCRVLFNDSNKQSLALKYCEQSANDNNHESQMLLGKLLMLKGDIEQAVGWLEKSAENNAEARFMLGTVYESDKYARKNEVTSLFYYRRGCELGHLKSCERVNTFEAKNKPALDKAKQKLEKEALLERQKEEKRLAEERKAFELSQENERQRLELERKKLALEAEKLKALKAEQREQNYSRSVGGSSAQGRYLDLSTYTGKLKFYNGLSAFQENGLYGFVDPDGKIVISPKFKYAGRFSRGRSAVQSPYNDLWGFIDTKGNYVVGPIYCMLGAYSESDGLAGVYQNGYKVGNTCKGGKWGFMDLSGRWAINPVLDNAERFINGKAKVVYQGNTGYINASGQWVN